MIFLPLKFNTDTQNHHNFSYLCYIDFQTFYPFVFNFEAVEISQVDKKGSFSNETYGWFGVFQA